MTSNPASIALLPLVQAVDAESQTPRHKQATTRSMSKAPKAKKVALHYQPYQALGAQSSEGDEPSMDLGMSDLPMHLDPVLSGLSSNMSRNLWDDWNENDANFGMKFDMFTDEVSTASTASSTASPNPSMHVSSLSSTGFEQQQNASPNTMHTHGPAMSTMEEQQKPRANVQRSLSEDIVNMLDETNEASFPKHMETGSAHSPMHGVMFNPQSLMGFQQQVPNHIQPFQQQQMQIQMQQQHYQQQQQFQQTNSSNSSNWMNNFGGGTQTSATTNAPASGKPSNPFAHRQLSNTTSPSTLDIAVAEGTASLVAKCPTPHSPAASTTSSSLPSTVSSAPQHAISSKENPGAQIDASSGANKANSADTAPSKTDANLNDPSQQANAFGQQGMMMNPFLMYSMMGAQGMNMMGMPMQMPMGMNGMNTGNGMNGTGNGSNNMNGMNGMNGMPLPMQMQLQLQLQMQMAQMAQMNGMGMNGMQMPMGLPGMPMGMNMQMPLNMNMQQPVNPQSGQTGDVEMAPAFPIGVPPSGGQALKPARALQPKGARGGPGFVSIARKPEEPEVSSILKSLMDEEAKKKEKKLERNRDSARESRKKQQTYVETLENGINPFVTTIHFYIKLTILSSS
ncbi:hypothetical protein DVH05_023688 [Phytophthora capsici]|nr:hypothetical protein DVH05_023688 [Phytophthora capsici]